MKVNGIKYMLMAQDMARATAFYRDCFGLTVRFASPDWSELALGGAIVALHGGWSGGRHPTGLSFEVDDIEEAVRIAVAGGATVDRAPQTSPGEPIKLADLVDPEGNTFMLSQYVGD